MNINSSKIFLKEYLCINLFEIYSWKLQGQSSSCYSLHFLITIQTSRPHDLPPPSNYLDNQLELMSTWRTKSSNVWRVVLLSTLFQANTITIKHVTCVFEEPNQKTYKHTCVILYIWLRKCVTVCVLED